MTDHPHDPDSPPQLTTFPGVATFQPEHMFDAIASLRQRGETGVCVLPGHESEIDEFHCDRELVSAAGQWVVQAI